MKQGVIAVSLLVVLCGPAWAGDRQTSFTLSVDPPDAVIRVVSGSSLKEQRYKSPASIKVSVAEDTERAKKNIIEISRDKYKPAVIALRSVRTGESLKIQLEKIVSKRLKFRMVAPAQSDTLQIKDGQVQLGLFIDEKQIQMSLMNNTTLPIRVLWQRAAYTDAAGRYHRIMHPGIRYEERNRSFPYQTVMPFKTIHQPLIPADMIVPDRLKNTYETKPLFPPEAVEQFKGKTFELLLPIEIENKGVVSYAFKVKVLGMVAE